MAGELQLAIIGNLTADPELEFTSNSKAVCKFTICQTARKYNKTTHTWEDTDPVFMRCVAWNQMAEHIGESFTKGTRVIAQGTLRQNNFQDKEGNRRTIMELQIEDIGASAKFAVVTVARPTRTTTEPAATTWGTTTPPPF